MSTTIYVLRLQRGKYYVGKADDVQRRFQQHQNGRGAAWTQKYPPIAIEKTIRNASAFEEDKVTKEYMAKHGIDNVRGGTYVSVELDESQEDALQKEIRAATDCCTRCGRKGHFVKDCYAGTVKDEAPQSVYGATQVVSQRRSKKEELFDKQMKAYQRNQQQSQQGKCYRCGRAGHYSPDCYAQTHANGGYLDEDDDDEDDDEDDDY